LLDDLASALRQCHPNAKPVLAHTYAAVQQIVPARARGTRANIAQWMAHQGTSGAP
jgi:hypothetical protein